MNPLFRKNLVCSIRHFILPLGFIAIGMWLNFYTEYARIIAIHLMLILVGINIIAINIGIIDMNLKGISAGILLLGIYSLQSVEFAKYYNAVLLLITAFVLLIFLVINIKESEIEFKEESI